MDKIKVLIQQVKEARHQFIKSASGLTPEQATFKASTDVWSVVENVEHIVWAEKAGVYKMWMAIEDFKKNPVSSEQPPIHDGLTAAEIIAKTWQSKEQAPDIAQPRWGGTIEFWLASLQACQPVLEALGKTLDGLDMEKIIYPHPISGPMNIVQRFEFLAFHLDRHQSQIERIKAHPNFPK